MNRRDFLRTTTSSVAVPLLIDGFGATAFAKPTPFMLSLMEASAQTDRVLVVIQLQGGNDGLNTVIPLDQMSIYTASTFRGNIAIPENKALRLVNNLQTGLHPAMTGMQQLFNNGKLGIVQGVSYPTPNFSHFRASDIWLTAVDASKTSNSGWAGRYLDRQFPNFPMGYPTAAMPDPPAIQIGYIASPALLGPSTSMAVVLQDPDTFARLLGEVPSTATIKNTTYAGQQVDFIRQQQISSVGYASQIKGAATKGKNLASYPSDNALAAQLKIIARLIHGGLQTKLYYLTLNGFDTHASQVVATDTTTGVHANLLKTLSDAITAFQADLEQLKLEGRVVGMTFSEFGRRAVSNGSRGTDHGTAAPMFIFGTGVKTQMIGKNPSLTDLDNNNLKMQTDFRQVYAAVLMDWFGADASTRTTALFREFAPVPVFRTTQVVTGLEAIVDASLYPNPASDEVILESPVLASGIQSLQLADMSGRLARVSFTIINPQAVRISLGELPMGNYMIHVETSKGVLTRRLIIAR